MTVHLQYELIEKGFSQRALPKSEIAPGVKFARWHSCDFTQVVGIDVENEDDITIAVFFDRPANIFDEAEICPSQTLEECEQ